MPLPKPVIPAQVKKRVGRPPKYPTPELLETAINAYFEYCDKGRETILTDRKRIPIVDPKTKEPKYYIQKIPPTMEGLASFLGFRNPGAMWRYRNKPTDPSENEDISEEMLKINRKYVDSIMGAKNAVNQAVVERSMIGEYDSKIASLVMATHAGYNTKQNIELTGKGGGPVNMVHMPKMPEGVADWNAARVKIDDDAKAKIQAKEDRRQAAANIKDAKSVSKAKVT